MSKNRPGKGKPFGAKAFTEAEDREIRLGLQRGMKAPAIAKGLGRGRSSVYLRIQKMVASGLIAQVVLNLGPLPGTEDDRTGR